MPITAVLFDLDDTLLWDERSVEEAFGPPAKQPVTLLILRSWRPLSAGRPEASTNLMRHFRLRR